MYARRVFIKLKPNTSGELTQKLEKEILPLLRKSKGFQDEIVLVSRDGSKAFAISLWDKAESAEDYQRETYPKVLKFLKSVTDEAPQVGHYQVTSSTFHKIVSPLSM